MTEELDLDLEPEIRPSLYNINKSFDVLKSSDGRYTGIKGEDEARMVLFTNFILGEKPVILKGSRASGKTNIAEVVSRYAKNPIIIASSSEKVYQRHEKLNDYTHFIIPEINKINDNTLEMLKDFGEDATHEYSFLNQLKIPVTITIDPKPFITGIADENKNVNALGEELLSRVTIVRTDSSIKQNINVIEEKLNRAENPFYKKSVSQDEVHKYIEYVHGLPSIRKLGFIYPAGTAIRTAIPPLFTDSRRDMDKYLSNTYGITLFYYYDRLKTSINEKNYLFVTPADMWYNHIVYQNILLDSSLKCGRIEKEILSIVKEHGGGVTHDKWGNKLSGLKISDIHSALLKKSYTPTIDAVNKYCVQLMEIGYLTRNEEVRPFRFSLNPELKREYTVKIDWLRVVEQCKKSVRKNFPDAASEYINRFCENGLDVIHPITGESCNVLEWVDDSLLSPQLEDEVSEESQDIVLDDDLSITETVDVKDSVQVLVLNELRSNPVLYVDLFNKLSSEQKEVFDDVLSYLVRIGEIIKDKDVYKLLV